MKKQFFLTLFLYLFFLPLSFGQKSVSTVWQQKQMRHFQNTDTQLSGENFFQKKAEVFNLAEASEMKQQQTAIGFNGIEHLKFQQYHQEIPVFGATYMLHSQNGIIKSSNGYFRPNIPTATSPSISAQEALQIAIHQMNAKVFIWEKEVPQPLSLLHQKPVPHLVWIDPAYPKKSEKTLLAYQVDLYSWKPLDKQRYFIDAQNGQVLAQLPLLPAHAVPATAETRYYGTQDIIVDSIAPTEFYLRDLSRGQGIQTFDAQVQVFENTSSHWDLKNPAQDEVALDAHYCAEKNYDLLLQKFQWNGINNQGGSMNSLVHLNDGAKIVNAFWDGSMALFGDGDCYHTPLTTLEIVGHEFTHGVIQHSSQLIYAGEPGAINESLADVFGKLLEYTEDPSNFNWSIGLSFNVYADDPPFRSMQDPKSLDNPAFYQGEFWVDGGGVHSNSGVGNHWFYLLSEGASGINENNEAYDITGIGIEKAADIVFLCNRSYLVPDSDYLDYMTLSTQAAEEIFGVGSTEVLSVKEAWKAVGLPIAIPDVFDLALSIPPEFERIEICQHSGFFPSQCILTNLGNESYTPTANDSLHARFLSTSGLKTISIPLTSELAPGAAITFSFDMLIYIDQEAINTTHNYSLSVNEDQNEDNNTVYGRFKNDVYTSNALAMVFATVDSYDCQNASHQVRSLIKNQGCETFEANQPFDLILQDSSEDIYWSKTITLGQEIPAGRFVDFQEAIPFTPEEGKDYFLTLDVPNNPLDITPKAVIVFWDPQTIAIDYQDDFTNSLKLDEKAQFQSNYSPPIYSINQEHYLMTSGVDSTFFRKPCFLPEGNLEGAFRHPISGIFTFCADFSEVDFPVVAFDLIQYRNTNMAEPFVASSMMKLSWDGMETGQQIIYGQEEGQVVAHEIPLPPNFNGQLEFKFSNFTGTQINAPDFLDYDLNLLDNLRFFNDPSLSFTTPPESLIQIFPNPVLDQLQITNADEIQELRILNTQGQIVYSDANFSGQSIDLSNLPNGYYWLSIWKEDRENLVLPFVKMRR